MTALDLKIVTALERLSEALRLLFWEQGKEYNLSPIQIQVLSYLYTHPYAEMSVTKLAYTFNLTKATMSDSLEVLANKDLIFKIQGIEDRRSYQIQLTDTGKILAGKLSDTLHPLINAIHENADESKQKAFHMLLKTIENLVNSGIISPQKMCLSCRHFSDQGTPYCNLLKKKLPSSELQIDCPEHESSLQA